MPSIDMTAEMIRLGRTVVPAGIGYNQWARWSWLDRAGRRIVPHRDTDCSALCAGLAWLAGYQVDISGTCWTGNLATLMQRAGWSVLRYTSASDVRPGDMVLNQRSHVVLALSATEWLSAERDERGRAHGGQPGDQDGREVYIRAPYERPGGWEYVLRPPAEPSQAPDTQMASPVTRTAPFPRLSVDGIMGPRTVAALQWWWGVKRDGILGPTTRRIVQSKLGLTTDGVWGPQTIRAVQRLVGATPDGIMGPRTIRALQTWLNQKAGHQ